MPAHRRLPHRTLPPAEALARGPAALEELDEDAVSFWTAVTQPALILGRAARAPVLDDAALARASLAVHQRASGGGAVLWDDDLLSLDVALPAGHSLLDDDVVVAYRWIGEAVRDGLRDAGVAADALAPDAARARPAPASPTVAACCFGTFSPWEIVGADGRKIAGLCQIRRRRGGLLQVGIARRLDGRTLIAALGGDERDGRELAARAGDLGAVAGPAVIEMIDRRLEEALGSARVEPETAAERRAASALAAGRFAAR